MRNNTPFLRRTPSLKHSWLGGKGNLDLPNTGGLYWQHTFSKGHIANQVQWVLRFILCSLICLRPYHFKLSSTEPPIYFCSFFSLVILSSLMVLSLPQYILVLALNFYHKYMVYGYIWRDGSVGKALAR